MFVEPLPKEKYYRRTYEYLGKKLKIQKITRMSEVENLEFILSYMGEKGRKKFFSDNESECFKESFGSISITIARMQKYENENRNSEYEDAIQFLLNEKKKYEYK